MSITVFTGVSCPSCVQLKRYLTYKKLDFTEKSIVDDDNAALAFKLSGAMTVPIVLIEDDNKREIVIGYNLPRLASALSF